MASNGTQFNASIKDWAKKFPEKMDALARQTSMEMCERVVVKTPVDTGFLRSSWQPAIGNPKAADGKAMGAGALAYAMNQIGITVPQMKAGDHFYMTNNAKYAPHVEFGTTKMAGRFYVTDNVKNWKNVVAGIASELGLK